MEFKNKFTEFAGVKWPIIQAPMIGFSEPEMVAAVSNSGALGSLAAGSLSVEELRQKCEQVNSLTNKAYTVNVFVNQESSNQISNQNEELKGEVYDALIPYYQELELDEEELYKSQLPSSPDLVDQLNVIIASKVPMVSFTFGLPPKEYIEELKYHHIKTMACATTIREAYMIEEAGIDVAILQGIEAGGHRASFCDHKSSSGERLLSLITQAKDQLSIPLVAAGGIMNGFMVYACLMRGAQAAQMGTAFLFSKEAYADDAYLNALSTCNIETCLSNSFTGKYARVIRNRFTDEMRRKPVAKFPLQSALTETLRNKASKLGRKEFLPYWAGQSASLGRKGSAEWLVNTLATEFVDAIYSRS